MTSLTGEVNKFKRIRRRKLHLRGGVRTSSTEVSQHPPPRSAPESSYIQFSKQENGSSSRSMWIPRKHRKNARAENPGLKAYPMCLKVDINISVLFSVAVQGRRPVLSMPCRFKYRYVIKFAFMLFTVYGIGALFVLVFTPLPLDHPGQEDGLSDIAMETSKRNRCLGE